MRRRAALVDDPGAREDVLLDELCEVWRAQLAAVMPAAVAEDRRAALGAQLTGLARLQGWRS